MGEFSHHCLLHSSLSFLKVWIHPHIFPWLLPLMQASLNGSIWSTVSVTVINNLMVTWSIGHGSKWPNKTCIAKLFNPGGALHLSGPPSPLVPPAVECRLHRAGGPAHRGLEHLQVLPCQLRLWQTSPSLRFAELDTCFTEQLVVPKGLVGGDNTTELAKNLTYDMDNITLANLASLPNSLGSNLTTLVVMVPRVCPTALRKSHWYTR